MRRITAVAALVLGVIALVPTGASGGGVDYFEFRRRFYTPGETAVGRTRVWFGSEERARAATHGRFVAYLLPENSWLSPPSVPKAAIALGPVTFTAPDGNRAIAALEFTVPEVPNGDWNINVCNVPCTNSMIPNLVGGSIRIVRSPGMAAMMHAQERLRLVRNMARADSRRTGRELHVLRVQLNGLRAEVEVLEDRLESRERSSREDASAPTRFPAPVGWILVALTVLFGLVAFRPRRRPPFAPDPPELERIDDPEREPVMR
jgi:hypothetical protein